MSLKLEGSSCVRCKSYLFSEDDVVYCPVCGAPHHRECYNALGHCALEELHGTENEYSKKVAEKNNSEVNEINEPQRTATVKCEMCGEEYDLNAAKCPNCNTPNIGKIGGFSGFDLLGGIPKDYDLGDGVTADDVKKFVATNTHRYIPKFAKLNKKNKISWNWMAFLFPSGWMLSRKMYKSGIITALLTIAVNILSYPLNLKLYNLGFDANGTFYDKVEQMTEILPRIGLAVIVLSFVSAILDFVIRFVFALLGDYIYKNHCVSTIKKIKKESNDILTDYRKKGGMSMLLFFLGFMLIQYGSTLVMLFLN